MSNAPMPLLIRMHPDDNVAIVANDGGLPAGTVLPPGVPGAGLVLPEAVPQGHKLALADLPAGAEAQGMQFAGAAVTIGAVSLRTDRVPTLETADLSLIHISEPTRH